MLHDAKVLVVDDTPANLKVVTETLDAEGYEVSTALSGDRCLKRLQNFTPDLILLDVQMPGIDGFETCQQIKANPELSHIPIIFLTALSDATSTVRGFDVGAVDYISKPFQKAELLARVKTHLQLQQANQRLEQQVQVRTQALEQALQQLQSSQLQLVQQEKMSALGNLVAGVAHEINNPVSCIKGNIVELEQNIVDIMAHLDLHDQQADSDTLVRHADDIDLKFLREDIPKMLTSMEAGCDRIYTISTSLRAFSRADQEDRVDFNVHEGLDSTLNILRYRLKAKDFRPEIQVVCDYGRLPELKCFPGPLNQVFMNILANAIDMFDEIAYGQPYTVLESHPQQIKIQTRLLDSADHHTHTVEIRISDNGKGIEPDICAKIFERTYTTKPVGKGTGLGLAIARQIIEDKHSGSLNVLSEVGCGTTFKIEFPIQ